MTFREFVESEATWFDRLLCRVFGCNIPKPKRDWYPCDDGEDRRREWRGFCCRCGRRP